MLRRPRAEQGQGRRRRVRQWRWTPGEEVGPFWPDGLRKGGRADLEEGGGGGGGSLGCDPRRDGGARRLPRPPGATPPRSSQRRSPASPPTLLHFKNTSTSAQILFHTSVLFTEKIECDNFNFQNNQFSQVKLSHSMSWLGLGYRVGYRVRAYDRV